MTTRLITHLTKDRNPVEGSSMSKKPRIIPVLRNFHPGHHQFHRIHSQIPKRLGVHCIIKGMFPALITTVIATKTSPPLLPLPPAPLPGGSHLVQGSGQRLICHRVGQGSRDFVNQQHRS